MLRLPAVCAVSAALLAACGSSPRPAPEADRTMAPDVMRDLSPGTVVRLEPATVAVSGSPISAGYVDATLREALRLSARFDIAGALEDMPAAPFGLRPRIDAAASIVTLSLVPSASGGAVMPLAAASYAEQPLPRAIDELAWRARIALGETVSEEPPRSAEIYSASPTAVRETEAALADENRGLHGSRRGRLERALRSDPGCTMAMALQSAAALIARQHVEAVRICETALRTLPNRTAPTTAHRLGRVLWLARGAAATDAAEARRCDEELLILAERFLAERPHDPHGRYTRALANANLGLFDAALEDLRALRERWPSIPWVAYHLAFAELAVGDPDAALDQLDSGARRLSSVWTLLPRALALYESGRHEELVNSLDRLARRRRNRTDDLSLHEIRRMLAAHAILTDRPEDAVDYLLEDLEWLRERPSMLDRLAEDLADDGTALVALGRTEELERRLGAFRTLPTEAPNLQLSVTFLEGLVAIGRDEATVARAASELEAAGRPATAARLIASALIADGEAAAAAERLERASVFGDDPRVTALLATAQRSAGRPADAQATAESVLRRLSTLRLRGPLEHPLLGPGLALAWRLAGGKAPVNRGA